MWDPDRYLTFAGQRKGSVRDDRKEKLNIYSRERAEGEFRRVVSLPDDADPDRVNATYRNGIVHISIQKREASRPRRIEVKDAR